MENRLLDTPVEDLKKRLLTPPTTSEDATALTELMYSMEVAIDGGTFPPGVGAEKMFCADMEPYLNAARVLLEEWENKEQFGLDLPLKVFLLSHLQDGKGLPSPTDEDLANTLGDADVTRRVQQGGTLTLNEERALAKALDLPPHCFYNTPSFLPNIHQAPRRGIEVWAKALLDEGASPTQTIHVVIPQPDTRDALETLRYLKAALLKGANVYHSPGVGGQHRYSLLQKDLYAGHGLVSFSPTLTRLSSLVMNTFEYLEGAPESYVYQDCLENMTKGNYTSVILYTNDLPTLQGLYKCRVHCVLPDIMGHGDRRIASLIGGWDLTKYSLDTLYHRLVSPKPFLQKEGLHYPQQNKE